MSWSACWSCMMTTQPTWPMMRSPLSERIWRDEGLKLTQCWWDQNPSCVSELLNKDKYVNFIKTYNVENPLLLIVNFELSLFCHYKTQACYFSVKIITACTQYIYIQYPLSLCLLSINWLPYLVRSRTRGTNCIADTSCRTRCPTVTSAREVSTTIRDTLLMLR